MKKKVVYLGLLFLSLFALKVNNVEAANLPYAGTLYNTLIGYTNQQKNSSVSFWKHSLGADASLNPFKSELLLHCIDPGDASGNLGGWVMDQKVNGGTLYVKRKFMDGTTKYAYDQGFMTILAYSAKSTSEADYFVATEAIRLYRMLFGYAKVNNSSLDYTALIGWYNDLCGNAKVNTARKAINKKTQTSSACKRTVSNKLNGTSSLGGVSIATLKKRTEDLVLKGVQAVIDYKNKSAASIDIPKSGTVTSLKNGKATVTRTITISNFTTKGAYAKLNITCKDCAAKGVSAPDIYVNDKKVSNGYNLLSSVSNGSGKVSVRLEFKTSNASLCEKVYYDFVISAYDASISMQGAIFTLNKGYDYQDFAGITSLDSPREYKKSLYIMMCSRDCEDLKDSCENGNQTACDRFEDLYGGNCAKCTTKVDNVPCQEGDSTIKLVEGIEVSDDDACNVISETPNVKDCIVNGRDIADNPYQIKNNSLTDYDTTNPYCNVFCSENYEIDVPGIEKTNSGRFIELRAGVRGNKSCYTGKIDTEKFETDLEAARKKVIDAWNTWNKWYTGYNNGQDSYPTCSASGCCGKCSATRYERKWTYKTMDYNGGSGTLPGSLENGSCSDTCRQPCIARDEEGKCTNWGCTGSVKCTDGNKSAIMSQIKSSLNSATSQLDSAIDNYNKILRQYNSCSATTTQTKLSGGSTGNSNIWKMKYDYKAKVGYWYEDNYMDLTTEKFLITDGAVAKGGLSVQTCSGDVDKAYGTCSTGWVANSATTKNEGKFVCYQSGSIYTCSVVNTNIATAKYVKQSQDVSVNYKLPTQFYTIYPSGKLINEQKEGTSPLENALPISLNVGAGVYNYTLTFQDLGEYYDSTKLGRIWGDENSTVVAAQADDSACKTDGAVSNDPNGGEDGNVSYVCAYKVNCPECNVTCDPDDGCIWQECKDGACTVFCEDCVFTNGSVNYSYRSVTTSDINPNNRDLGHNWNYKENQISTATELKAAVTTNEIVTKGETIYEDENDIALTVDLSQAMINDIKNYNKSFEGNEKDATKRGTGGYGSNSLSCYDFTDSDGKVYENVYCYSTFLDELEKNYSDRLVFNKERVNANNRSKVKNQCESGDPSKCYWTTWTDALSKPGLIVTTNYGVSFNRFYNNYDKLGVGPSWK